MGLLKMAKSKKATATIGAATKAVKLGKDKKLKADTGGVVASGESVFSDATWGKLKIKHGSEKDLLGKLSAKDGRGSK